MSNRTDVHSPKNFRPQDYSFVDFYYIGNDEWGRAANSEYTAKYIRDNRHVGPHGLGKCDHCGTWYAYGAIFQHEPTGGWIAVGHDCAQGRFQCPDDFTFRRNYIAKVVAGQRMAGKKAAAVQALFDAHEDLAAAFEWGNEVTDLLNSDGMVEPDEDGYGYQATPEGRTYRRLVGYNANVLTDMEEKLRRYGSLSDKQIAFALKLYTEGQKKLADAKRIVEEVAAMQPLEAGRREVEGEIVSVKTEEGYHYHSPSVTKMLVKLDSGHKVYATVPAAIEDDYFSRTNGAQIAFSEIDRAVFDADTGSREERQAAYDARLEACYAERGVTRFGNMHEWLRGKRVRFTATIKPKGNDFAIASRPTKAELLTEVSA